MKVVKWSHEEDDLLCQLVGETAHWPFVGTSFPQRDNDTTCDRWHNVLDLNLVKGVRLVKKVRS